MFVTPGPFLVPGPFNPLLNFLRSPLQRSKQNSELAKLSQVDPSTTNTSKPTLAGVGYGLPYLYNAYDPTGDVSVLNIVSPVSPFFRLNNPYLPLHTISDPDADPDLRKDVIKFYYNKLKHSYFNDDFKRFLHFVIIDNNTKEPRLVKSMEELKSNTNYDNADKRIRYILDNIFGKYELEALIATLVARNPEITWVKLQTKYKSTVKDNVAKKLLKNIEKKLSFKLE